jgi:hypothetical protein
MAPSKQDAGLLILLVVICFHYLRSFLLLLQSKMGESISDKKVVNEKLEVSSNGRKWARPVANHTRHQKKDGWP